ncbi:MAG TPA: glycosyltransferase family 9 protein [Vicinamibacterales bacterium]|jgi:ADP-heptose:LPS heptosyltransferase
MLQILDRRERWLVRAADAALAVASAPRRVWPRRAAAEPRRILLLRLERIGDLVMALEAIRDVRTLAPAARIDLVVGSWNADIARAVTNVDAVETLDAEWLARERKGHGTAALARTAWSWRDRGYDLGINFEPDVRSNLVLAASGAARTVGWSSGGGSPVLDVALDYDPSSHTALNARRLVAAAFGRRPADSARPLLVIPDAALAAAAARLRPAQGRPIVGVHVSGGRAIKQWEPSRFAEVAARLADARGAAIVATGSAADRPLIDALVRALHPRSVIAADDENLLASAALLARIDLLITGDTGPMHLASAVGTPVVAVFGPSDPARYATRGPLDRVVRVDLPCSPCNRIRRPPARCAGHTPDCLVHVAASDVYDAAIAVLDASAARRPRAGRT